MRRSPLGRWRGRPRATTLSRPNRFPTRFFKTPGTSVQPALSLGNNLIPGIGDLPERAFAAEVGFPGHVGTIDGLFGGVVIVAATLLSRRILADISLADILLGAVPILEHIGCGDLVVSAVLAHDIEMEKKLGQADRVLTHSIKNLDETECLFVKAMIFGVVRDEAADV